MTFDVEPGEFEEMASGGSVTEYAVVLPVQIEACPVFVVYPVSRFVRVCSDGVSSLAVEHPCVDYLECIRSYLSAVIVRPSSNDWVERFNDCFNVGSVESEPVVSQLFSEFMYRFFTWFDEYTSA